MQFFGFFSLMFGALVIIYPELLAYLIGSLFFIIGINILMFSWLSRRRGSSTGSTDSWKFGSYEILKNHKK